MRTAALVALTLLTLAGCATKPPPPVTVDGVRVDFGRTGSDLGTPGLTLFQFTPGVADLDRRIALAKAAVARRGGACRWIETSRSRIAALTAFQVSKNAPLFLFARTTCK